MKDIKLTNLQGKTHNGMQWDIGITHTIKPNPNYPLKLCTDTCLHFYPSPEIAAFMYPAHISYTSNEFLAWTCEAEEEIVQDGTKCGCQKLTITGRYTTFPEPTQEQRIYFAIIAALEVCQNAVFIAWANAWINRTDRTKQSAAYTTAATYTTAAYAVSYAAFYALQANKNINLQALAEKALAWNG